MKVKVRIFTFKFIQVAYIYYEDAKMLYDVFEYLKNKIKEIIPFVDDIDIDIYINDLNSKVNESDLKRGIIAITDSWSFGTTEPQEFIDILKRILDSKNIEYEIDIVNYM